MPDSAIAIVGMACVFPDAAGVEAYWRNILKGHDAIRDPEGFWDIDAVFAPGDRRSGRIYARRGGSIPPSTFDAARYAVLPKAAADGDAEQWLTLAVADEALADAGIASDNPVRQRTGVVLGKGGYPTRGQVNPFFHGAILESVLTLVAQLRPDLSEGEHERVRQALAASLPAFDADTVSGIVPNIAASRIANRLNLMGPAYTIDAACASSLIAVDLACQYLASGQCDTVLAGGVQLCLAVGIRQVFSQLGALSPSEEIRPFDREADGTLPGDGLGMVVLKRLDDASRDGDRIYAVVRGVGTSSDGRGLGVMAPRGEGQVLALQRAYAAAGIEPHTVGLIEAHGTGTPLGDPTEVASLRAVFGDRRDDATRCGIGSVKSMIGHLMPAAGIASLIKAALALYHSTLPPTLKVREPLPLLAAAESPFALITRARPWLAQLGHPRRAGVNAFGFGGINAHLVLEEAPDAAAFQSRLPEWESELVLVGAPNRDGLRQAAEALARSLSDDASLAVIARDSLALHCRAPVRAAVVAASAADLKAKLARLAGRLADPRCKAIRDPQGIFWFAASPARTGKTAFLFPGEGSQYPGMLAGLHPHFPEIRQILDGANRCYERRLGGVLPADFLFPEPLADEAERERWRVALWSMNGAVTAVLAANFALLRLVSATGLRPDAVLGHSTGEFVALAAGGVIPLGSQHEQGAFEAFADALWDAYAQMPPADARTDLVLAAIGADAARVRAAITAAGDGALVAMDNCTLQTVVAGPRQGVEALVARFSKEGVLCEQLAFDRPYHTPDFEPFLGPLRSLLSTWATSPGKVPIWTCATGSPLPTVLPSLREVAADQWCLPVAFRPTIEAMHADGFRIFVEVGARGNLSAFTGDILRGKPHLCVPLDLENRPGTTQFCHALGLLIAAGHDLDPEILFRYRRPSAPTAASAVPPVPVRLETPQLRLPEEEARRLTTTAAMPEPAAAVPEAAKAAPDGPPKVLAAHFETMAGFLAVQQEVMGAYLGGCALVAPASSPGPGPLLDAVLALEPQVRAEALVRFDPERHRYLRDHEFGRRIAPSDPARRGIPIVPLTVSLEVMAETAALLMPGLVVTGFRDVRGHQWIQVPSAPVAVQVVAERNGSDVRVRLVPHGPDTGGAAAYAEATVCFAATYPAAPLLEPLILSNPHPSPWGPADLYQNLLFHGPAFQGMERIEAIGAEGLKANVRVPVRSGLVAGTASPAFHADPVALDVAGQLLGTWHHDVEPNMICFPARIAAIDLYGPPPAEGLRLSGTVRIRHRGGGFLGGDIQLGAADRILLSCSGWVDRTFAIPRTTANFWRDPSVHRLASAVPAAGGLEQHWRIDAADLGPGFFTTGGGIWTQTTLQCLLVAEEHRFFHQAGFGVSRRDEWLLGRIAAKDAVRDYVRRRTGRTIALAEIAVLNNADGRPVVSLLVQVGIEPPSLSIAHSAGRAVAAVAEVGEGIGIDIEPADRIRRMQPSFWTKLLGPDLAVILPEEDPDLWRLRLWCAREAAAKALGRGLGSGLMRMRVRRHDPHTGLVQLDPGDGGSILTAATAVEAGWVIATCRIGQNPSAGNNQ